MAAESEMSASSKIRKAATEREWCPGRPSAEAAQPRRNKRRGPKHSRSAWGEVGLLVIAARSASAPWCGVAVTHRS